MYITTKRESSSASLLVLLLVELLPLATMPINRLTELPTEKPPSVTPDFCFSPVLSLPDTPEPVALRTPTIKTSKRGPPKVTYLEVLNDAQDRCISPKFVPRPPSLPKPQKQVRFRSSPVESADYLDDFEPDDGETKEKAVSPAKLTSSKTPPPAIPHNAHSLTSMTGGDTVFSSKKRSDDLDSADEVSDEEIEGLETSQHSSSKCTAGGHDHSDDRDSKSPEYPVFKTITQHPSRSHLKYHGRRIITHTQTLQITRYHEPMPPRKPQKGSRHQPWMTRTGDTPPKSPSKSVATLINHPRKPLNQRPARGSDNKALQPKINTLELLPPQPPKRLHPRPPPPQRNRRHDSSRRRVSQVHDAGNINKAEGAQRGRHD